MGGAAVLSCFNFVWILIYLFFLSESLVSLSFLVVLLILIFCSFSGLRGASHLVVVGGNGMFGV